MKTVVVTGLAALTVALVGFWLWTPDKSRAELEARYLQSPADMVNVTGQRLHLRDSGPKDAPAVILMHGFGASLQTWDEWAAGLAASHRVIRFDLPGSGLSGPDPGSDYTDARSVQLLLALMDQRGLARASIVGHSIGGRIAWTFAASHPERISRLVLVAPDGFASPGFVYGQPPEVPAMLSLMLYVLPRFLLDMSLEPAYADPHFLTATLGQRYHDLMLAPGVRDALLKRLQQTTLVDPIPRLARIQAPTLLLWGELDAMIPFANSTEYLRALPNATLSALPAVGHLPQEEAAARSLVLVREFLKPVLF